MLVWSWDPRLVLHRETSSSSLYWPKTLILISLLKKIYLLCAYTTIALKENAYLFNISDFKVQIGEASYYQWISLTFVLVTLISF